MPQLTHGARQALDKIDATVEQIEQSRKLAYQVAVSNPERTKDELGKIGRLMERLHADVHAMERLLERQAPEYEQRLAALEQWRKEIEEGKRVIPFPTRKEA